MTYCLKNAGHIAAAGLSSLLIYREPSLLRGEAPD